MSNQNPKQTQVARRKRPPRFRRAGAALLATTALVGGVGALGPAYAADDEKKDSIPSKYDDDFSDITKPASEFFEGVGSVIGYVDQAYKAYQVADCIFSAKMSFTDCVIKMGSDSKSIDDVYNEVKKLSDEFNKFEKQYKVDHQSVMAALTEIASDQKNLALATQVAQIHDDTERAHVGVIMMRALIDCSANMLAPDAGVQRCAIVDQYGKTIRTEPANTDTLHEVQRRFVSKYFDGNGNDLFAKEATVYSQILGGRPSYAGEHDPAKLDPIRQTGVLARTVDKFNSEEVLRQGFNMGTKLTVFPASYVNRLGQSVNQLIDEESGYYLSRIFAAQLAGQDELAQSLSSLADEGRDDSSPVLSLAQQRQVYLFPDWSPRNQLEPNQYLLSGERSGAIKVTVKQSAELVDNDSLPTEAQVTKLADDMGFAGNNANFDKLTAGDPEAFPAIAKQLPGNASAVARYYTRSRDDLFTTSPGHYRFGSTKPAQQWMINYAGGVFTRTTVPGVPATSRADQIYLGTTQSPAYRIGSANVVFQQTADLQEKVAGWKNKSGAGALLLVEKHTHDVAAGYARTAIQSDRGTINSKPALDGNLHVVAPQFSGSGHYDGVAFPALSISITPVAATGQLVR